MKVISRFKRAVTGEWRSMIGGAAGAAVVIVAFLIIGHSGAALAWAAWVQAIGSILAIVGTYLVTIRSERRAVMKEIARQEALMVECQVLVHSAKMERAMTRCAIEAGNMTAAKHFLRLSKLGFTQLVRLQSIAGSEWPSRLVYLYFCSLCDALKKFDERLMAWVEATGDTANAAHLLKRIEHSDRELQKAFCEYDSIAKVTGLHRIVQLQIGDQLAENERHAEESRAEIARGGEWPLVYDDY